MKKFKLFSLSPKLFAASILPPAIVAIFASIAFSGLTMKIINENVMTTAGNAARKLSNQIIDRLQPSVDKLANWQAIVSEIHEEKVLRRVIKGLSSDLSESELFYYSTKESRFSRHGFFINNLDWVPPDDWEPMERSWFKDAEANAGDFTYTEPYVDYRSGNLCVTFAQAVYNNEEDFLGVAALDLNLDMFRDAVFDVYVSTHGKVHIVNSEGLYLTNDDASKIMKGNYIQESSISELGGYDVADYLDGLERAFIKNGRYYAVAPIGTSPWFAVVEGPVSDFNAKFKVQVIVILCFMLLIGAICTLINMYVMGNMRAKEHGLGSKLIVETQNLAVASKENAATAQDQSAAVKEIVATMEDNNSLSENIATKIKDVSGVATKTSDDVSEGVSYIDQNVRQLREIAEANQGTISGIKMLGDKIENIWDIVTLINSVADQAKIIAFNAELEASSAGEAGKNFHIVATEIRRLADGIIDGTKEIKERINEIQESSDSLILASESGTEKINEGCESAKNLKERFTNIKNASEITASSAADITTIIQQQAVASEQMLITLKQISAGVENFGAATENISVASMNLKKIAEELNK